MQRPKLKRLSEISHNIVGIVEDYWEKVLCHTWGAVIITFLGQRSIGIFGDYKKKGMDGVELNI